MLCQYNFALIKHYIRILHLKKNKLLQSVAILLMFKESVGTTHLLATYLYCATAGSELESICRGMHEAAVLYLSKTLCLPAL